MNDNTNLKTSLVDAIVTQTGLDSNDAEKVVTFLHLEGFIDYPVVAEGATD